MERRVSIKRIIIDLLSIKEQVAEHFKDCPKYHVLINYLLTNKRLSDEDTYLPTFKEMEKESGIRIYHIRKQLTEIYDILFDSENGHDFSFTKTEITFSAKYNKKYVSFKCNNLTYIPRIGENVDLPFVKAKLGCDFFYVYDIRHWFSGNTHSIDISLKCGMFNSYWYNRLHEAEEKREISLNEYFDSSDWELKRKLMPKYHQ